MDIFAIALEGRTVLLPEPMKPAYSPFTSNDGRTDTRSMAE